uniref:Uncharacterized protein n=1 Tax=Trypanosoma congolense (strain IL3000) TaxID=1068625 RepID=G0UN37_TRYCI|nr:hypothetical protein, unlikely [Trypanosoma congolense IL3000]
MEHGVTVAHGWEWWRLDQGALGLALGRSPQYILPPKLPFLLLSSPLYQFFSHRVLPTLVFLTSMHIYKYVYIYFPLFPRTQNPPASPLILFLFSLSYIFFGGFPMSMNFLPAVRHVPCFLTFFSLLSPPPPLIHMSIP